MAAMVFSKVGGAGFSAISRTATSWAAMAASPAGTKSSTRTDAKGGSPPNGPRQGASRGLAFDAGSPAAATAVGTTRDMDTPRRNAFMKRLSHEVDRMGSTGIAE